MSQISELNPSAAVELVGIAPGSYSNEHLLQAFRAGNIIIAQAMIDGELEGTQGIVDQFMPLVESMGNVLASRAE